MGILTALMDKLFNKEDNGPLLGSLRDTTQIVGIVFRVVALILFIPILGIFWMVYHSREVSSWRHTDLTNPYNSCYSNSVDLLVDFNRSEVLTPDPGNSTPFYVSYHGPIVNFGKRPSGNIGMDLYTVLPFAEQVVKTSRDPDLTYIKIPRYIDGSDTYYRLSGSNPSSDVESMYVTLGELDHPKYASERDTLRGHNDPFDNSMLPKLVSPSTLWSLGFAPTQVQAKSRDLELSYIKAAKIVSLMRFEEACIRSNVPTLDYKVDKLGTTIRFKPKNADKYPEVLVDNNNSPLFVPRIGGQYIKNLGYDEYAWLSAYSNSFRKGMPKVSLFVVWLGQYPGNSEFPGIYKCLTPKDWEKGPFIMGSCLGDDYSKAQENSQKSYTSDFLPFAPITRPEGQQEVIEALGSMDNYQFWISKFADDGIKLDDEQKSDIQNILSVVDQVTNNEIVKADKWYPNIYETN